MPRGRGLSALAELDLINQPGVTLIAPPDAVLSDAASSSPRPAFASSLRTAAPSRHICWWPEREMLTAETLSRLHWMLQIGVGQGWLLTDPGDDEPLSANELRESLEGTNLRVDEDRILADGATAIRCVPR
ncbi:MAG: hypothetical protein R3C29_08570 [Dehalococcoidia bacterium]